MDLLDPIEIDLGEDHLLLDAEGIVPPAIKAPARQPAEIPDAGNRQIDEAIEKLVHPSASQCHRGSHWHALAKSEIGDRLFGASDHRLLTCDQTQFLDRSLELLRVLGGIAHP